MCPPDVAGRVAGDPCGMTRKPECFDIRAPRSGSADEWAQRILGAPTARRADRRLTPQLRKTEHE